MKALLHLCLILSTSTAFANSIDCKGQYVPGNYSVGEKIRISNNPNLLRYGQLAMVYGNSVFEYRLDSTAAIGSESTYLLTMLYPTGADGGKKGDRMLVVRSDGGSTFYNIDENGNHIPVTQTLSCK